MKGITSKPKRKCIATYPHIEFEGKSYYGLIALEAIKILSKIEIKEVTNEGIIIESKINKKAPGDTDITTEG